MYKPILVMRRRDGRRLLGESVRVHHSLGVLGGKCWEGMLGRRC